MMKPRTGKQLPEHSGRVDDQSDNLGDRFGRLQKIWKVVQLKNAQFEKRFVHFLASRVYSLLSVLSRPHSADSKKIAEAGPALL